MGVAGCIFASLFFVSLRGCDYVDQHDGFEIAVTRASLATVLAGSHGKSETAVLRIAGTEFRMLAGRSPHSIGDLQEQWLVCVASEISPETVIIIDESQRRFAKAESPLSGFGAFFGLDDNPHTASYDRGRQILTLTDERLKKSAVLKDFSWQNY